jgi:hypothetical protein
MTNPCNEEEVKSLPEIPDNFPLNNWLHAIFPQFSHIAEDEFFGDYGGYPSRHDGPYFMREGRRTTTELHGDVLPEQLYHLDGWFALEYQGV